MTKDPVFPHPQLVPITITFAKLEAQALAQFVKRVTWDEVRRCAVDDHEAEVIRDAIDNLRKALAEEGFAPR